MSRFLGLCFGTFLRLFRSHPSLLRENLAFRQQLVVLKRHHPRPKLYSFDKLFWGSAVWSDNLTTPTGWVAPSLRSGCLTELTGDLGPAARNTATALYPLYMHRKYMHRTST